MQLINSWFITQHIKNHNHLMFVTLGEKVHWHIDFCVNRERERRAMRRKEL